MPCPDFVDFTSVHSIQYICLHCCKLFHKCSKICANDNFKIFFTAPKPRNIVSAPPALAKRIPGSPRGTRSTQLRQATKTRKSSPPSPKPTPRSNISRGRAPLASPAPSISSTSSTTSSANSSKLVRQGTFTKEEGSSLSNAVLVEIDVDDKKPPKKPLHTKSGRSPRSDVPVIPQTRTSALRERSRSRQGSGSSTTSSNRSIPRPTSSLKQSNSNQSLNSRLGRRTPTNVDIVRNPTKITKDISDTCSESAVTSAKKNPGKKIESRIASLWKRVEDTKKKDKGVGGDKNKDKKVWISKGRVIPENEMAFLRPDEQQKKLIQDFQKAKADSSLNESNHSAQQITTKPRSKSRLSMKLPKFNKTSTNPLKKEHSFTYTSHTQPPKSSVSVPSTPNVEDVLNGNDENPQIQDSSKRISRTGSFVNPEDQRTRSSAIVQPFNYSPPSGPNSLGMVDSKKLRRNDSYVSSMGRTREELIASARKRQVSAHNEQDEMVDENGAPTSSVLVTLV